MKLGEEISKSEKRRIEREARNKLINIMALKGYNRQEIAKELNCSVTTVQKAVSGEAEKVLRKTGRENRKAKRGEFFFGSKIEPEKIPKPY